MKKYQLYGMGNALMDIIVQVDDVFLQTHTLDKGHMRLMDLPTQRSLLSAVHTNNSSLNRQSGGSAANTVVSFSHFGGRSCYACQIGHDGLGDLYLQGLQQAGVATHAPYAQMSGDTGTCLVLVTPDGERTLCTSLGVSAAFSEQTIYVPDLLAAECIYIEGYLLATQAGAAAAMQAQQLGNQHGIPVALTLSDASMVALARDSIAQLLNHKVALLFCNEEEALLYTGANDIHSAIVALGRSAACVAITQGAQGVTMFQEGRRWQTPGLSVKVKDTNGAGDVFAAAFLYMWFHHQDAAQAAQFACAAAAQLVQYLGPRLPQAQCQQVLQNFIKKPKSHF